MPGVLTKDQQFALIFETSSVQALLRHGVDQLLKVRYVDADIDPVLTTLSIGVEKLMKLTWGLLEVAAGRSWPAKTVMQEQGHGVKSLNELIDQHLGAAVGLPAQLWVQGLRDRVNNDPYWALILSALDSYGRSGRFYYLDQLAEQPQSWQSPRDDWDDLEQAISNDRPELLADLTGSNEDWRRARTEINAVIAASVTAWWEMIFRFWIQGAAGQFGKQHSTACSAGRFIFLADRPSSATSSRSQHRRSASMVSAVRWASRLAPLST